VPPLAAVLRAVPTFWCREEQRHAEIVEAAFRGNYTTVLNVVFLTLAAVLVIRFLLTGGPAMLRMMNAKPSDRLDHTAHHHGHAK